MAAITEMVDLEIRDGVAVVRIDNPPVNALSRGVRDGLFGAITQADADEAAVAILIICEGRTYIAGADIKEFGKPQEGTSLFKVQEVVEGASKPVISTIHGTALGGGLEVALTCHYRVAVASAKFGLPEVHLGILPGAGGTQRLPRVVGVEPYADQREEIFERWCEDIAALAACPNVYAKLGGLAMPDNGFGWDRRDRPAMSDEFVEAQARYYHHTIQCFGADRCMFESNFPVDRTSISYTVLWNGLKKIAAQYSEPEQTAMFSETATRNYHL